MAKKKPAVKKGPRMQPLKKSSWIQPAFDPRIYTFKFGVDKDNPLGTSLTRGLIKQAVPISGFSDINQVAFLYNPSQVSASYQLSDPSTTQAAMLVPQPGDDSILRVPLNQNVTFSLLFDRTYELWDSSKKSTSAGTYGVMVDVWAMQQLVGMNADPGAALNTSTKGKGQDSTLGSSGLMMTTFCDFYFGGRQSLQYFGSITAFDVTYTHWTQLMVPMRCAMNITVQLYPEDVRAGMVAQYNKAAAAKKKDTYAAPEWTKIPTANHGLPPGMSNTTGVSGR